MSGRWPTRSRRDRPGTGNIRRGGSPAWWRRRRSTPARRGLIRDSFAEAERRGLAWQIHAAQSVVEFHEITRRHGVTPVQWLAQLGVLSGRSIIGHGIFLDDHPRTRWWTDRDLSLLAEAGTTVAHCPTVFLRRGIALRDFGRYRRAGVRLGLGTDTYPHNMLEEMRHAAYAARLVAETPRTLSTADVFHAATVARGRGARTQTTSAAWRRAAAPTSSSSIFAIRRCVPRATRCAAWSIRPPNGRCARCSSMARRSCARGVC
ncbi:MAG: amidohydrolase family protein [Acetobacteraceae bacterium]|nr:amidohydrolase family protein [Acetobacteraceae bacterium]